MRDLEDLELLVDMGTPLVFIQSGDTQRVETLCARVSTRCGMPLHRWSLAAGLTRGDDAPAPAIQVQPADLLARILAAAEPGLWLLLDLAGYLEEKLVLSQLREIALRHERVPHTLLLPGSAIAVPSELRAYASPLDLALPSAEELATLVREEAEGWGRQRGQRVQATQAALDTLCANLAGLSHADARRLARSAIRDDGAISEADTPALIATKYRLLDQGGVLSFETSTNKFADVAGLANLKRWLSERRSVFLAPTPTPGIPILLVASCCGFTKFEVPRPAP
jgi:hypothetical protein